MEEAGRAGDTQGMDFNDFMRMLKVSSVDSLDLYDDRAGSWGSSNVDKLNQLLQKSLSQSSLDASRHGGLGFSDVSHHSVQSDTNSQQTDRSAHVFEMDLSQHAGNNVSPWRFDVAGPGSGTKPVSPSPAIQFRFDVGTGHAEPEARVNPRSSGSGAQGHTTSVDNTAYVGVGAASAVVNVGLKGGYFDKRHHGSNLYKNSVMNVGTGGSRAGASCRGTERSTHGSMHLGVLETVQE